MLIIPLFTISSLAFFVFLGDLLAAQPAKITLANRTHARAVTLAKQFADRGTITAIDVNDLPDCLTQVDVILYAIAHDHAYLPAWLPTDCKLNNVVCYDLAYQHTTTPFMSWATQQHAQAVMGGLGMLVEQAGLSFTYWHGMTVDTHPVLTQLRV